MSTRQDKSLHYACANGQSHRVGEILENNTDIADLLDLRIGFLGYTPLHEAACQGHDDILQLLLTYGANVNATANGNYTPLHIAASMDYVKCIKVLLKNRANIKALDDFHKTPYQTAIQHKRKASATYLKSAEIIQAAGKSPPELKDLLSETSTKDITTSCFDDALIEACHMGQFDAACMLLVAGAKKIKESICISIRNGHYRITALLLLCCAALSENVIALEMLLDKSLECYEWLQQFIDETVPIGTVIEKIRESLKNMEDYTSIAIQLPGLGTPVTVLKNLLVNTSCQLQEKKVNWSKLSLSKIDESWLVQIKSWVQYLNLSHNKLTTLPQSVVDLKMVVNLNLSKNKIKIVPVEIFSLISLRDLNLSGNAIADLPDVPQWRPILKSFNVSDNNLSSLPESIRRSCLETLNVSRNNFIRVPLSVCEIITLKNLDLSDNREINTLPVEMGKLRNLIHINLKNLDQVTDPPEQIRNCAEELVTTLRTRLRNCEPYYAMKLMLVGKGGQGKTTLVHRLRDDFTFKENDLTQGVEISDLSIKRGMLYRQYIFKVWDFGGQEDYYATHQCFLSTMSLYLLVWRLIDGEEGVQNLTPWLDNIAVRSPGSTVIVVGTHLDCITAEKHGTDYVTRMNERVRELVEKSRYKEKVILPPNGICAVSCAFGGSRAEIYNLRLVIYDTATNLKKGRMHVMGELIPSSFFSLIQRIEKRRDEVQKGQLPIIRKEEFDAVVKENSLHCGKDIQEPMDVRDATVFLRERGVIMHFDDPNEGLSDLYFIEPRWLCKLMARVITIRGHADLVKDGVLQIQETKTLFHSEDIPFGFYDQYIRLLVRFQIAYLLDASRVLVPSKLPEKEPEHVTKMQLPYAPVRRVYKIDYQRIHGFWPRFMSRFFFYVKEMIAVDATRYQKSKDSEHGYFGHFCLSCLRVDASSAGRFSCFLDPALWESRNNTEGSRRTSRGTFDEDSTSSSTSKNSATSQDTSKDIKSNPSRKDPSRNDTSRKDPTRKDSSRKDPSRNKPTRKDPSKKEPSKKKYTKREPSKNGTSVKVHPPTVNGPSQVNAFPINVSMPASAMLVDGSSSGNDDFHRLLLDPSVKLFSDDELQDDTDGQDRIVINNVDTGMDYSRKSESFHDKENESMRRVAMDLRIPSFDASLYDHGNRLRGLPRQKSTTSSGEEENTENQRNSSSGGEESSNNLPGKVNSDYQKDSGDASGMTEDVPSTSEYVAGLFEVNLNMNEDVLGKSEGVPNVTEDFVVENGENTTRSDYSEAHPDGNEDHPNGNNERTTSDRNNSEKIAAENNITGQVIIIKEDVLADGEKVSEVTDSEETKAVRIKIPSSGINELNKGIQSKPGEVNDDPACDVINDVSDVTDAGRKLQQTLEGEATISEAKSEMQSDDIAEKLTHEIIPPVYHSSVPQSPSSITCHPGESIDTTSSSSATYSARLVNDSRSLPSPSMYAGLSANVGGTSENVVATSGGSSTPPKTAGKQSKAVGEEPDSDNSEPEPVGKQSETPVVETKKCTLCKEDIVADQLVTIPVDVADLIEKKIVHCWRTGVCVAHPEVFLVVAYRELSDSILVEIAVSPNALGRRLLIFVVDHLDTLIKEWYPGLLMTYSSEPTIQRFIPCRNCEKDGKRRLTMFTFDSCVTQYSMGNFVKCFEHEVSIQDIAPDVVPQDIDADLLLEEEELHYERSDVNLIGKGKCGNVYRGRYRERDAAIKEYSEDPMERYSEVRNEVNVLRRLGQHPFLVNVIRVCLRPFRLVLELAMEGSLAKTLFNPLFLIDRIVVYRMLHQVADAISFLHSMDVIYRDLKPQNVLVMSYEERHDVNIKLTDFGTAAFQFNEGLFAIEGTVGYYAPEMLKEFCKRTGYNEKVDVFSLGMLVYSFITRRQPFFNINSPAEVNNMVIAGRRPEYDDIAQARIGLAGLTWLMDNCLSYEPTARYCCTTVAEQLRSTSFQLFMGIMALPCQQPVRHVGLVQVTLELWVAVDDKVETTVFVYDMKNWCLKTRFTVKLPRSSILEGVLVLQVNCMHVMASEVLIGLSGDLNLVAIFDAKSYQLKAKITNLEEPVFSLSCNDSFIFLGMSTGVCLVTSRTKIVRSIDISHSEPVTCVTTVGNDYLWLTAGNCIQIFQVEVLDKTPTIELHAVRFSSSSAPFSQTVLSVDGSNVWCVSKGDSIITAWNVNTRRKALEIDCKSILARSLSEDGACDLLESAVTCILPVLDTMWIGTGGGKLLIVDVTSGELITSLKLFDDHVRTLTLVPGPGPCGTEKYYVVVSGRKVLETALSRADQGKHVCRLSNDVIKPAPNMHTTPVKDIDRSKNQLGRNPFRRTPQSGAANSDGQDHGLNYAGGSVLMFFEALTSKVLQRTESK